MISRSIHPDLSLREFLSAMFWVPIVAGVGLWVWWNFWFLPYPALRLPWPFLLSTIAFFIPALVLHHPVTFALFAFSRLLLAIAPFLFFPSYLTLPFLVLPAFVVAKSLRPSHLGSLLASLFVVIPLLSLSSSPASALSLFVVAGCLVVFAWVL